MLLAIDIGNTNITFGLFLKRRIIKRFDLSTRAWSPDKLRRGLVKIPVASVVVCSVVPAAAKTICRDISDAYGIRPYLIGRDITVPIKNNYRKPQQVGSDRLVNAYAASILYGAPLIAVDFGTAATFDIISKEGQYLGGMILPGLRLCLEALAEKTALLPKISLTRPREFIGRDTQASMLSGVVNGFAAMTDELILRIRKQMRVRAKAVGTGGNIGLMSRYCRKLNIIDRDLTLKGINLLYRTEIKKNS